MRSKSILDAVRARPTRAVDPSEAQIVRPEDVPTGVSQAVRASRAGTWAEKEQARRDKERAEESAVKDLSASLDRYGAARQGRTRGVQPKTSRSLPVWYELSPA